MILTAIPESGPKPETPEGGDLQGLTEKLKDLVEETKNAIKGKTYDDNYEDDEEKEKYKVYELGENHNLLGNSKPAIKREFDTTLTDKGKVEMEKNPKLVIPKE